MNRKYLWPALLVCYVAFVFSNSLRVAAESAEQSGSVLLMVQQLLSDIGLGNIGITEHFIRKAAHFAEYTGMGLLIFKAVQPFQRPRAETVLWMILLGIFIPFSDETIQLFVEGRSGQISDVWLDMSGVLAGCIMTALFNRFLLKRWLLKRNAREV